MSVPGVAVQLRAGPGPQGGRIPTPAAQAPKRMVEVRASAQPEGSWCPPPTPLPLAWPPSPTFPSFWSPALLPAPWVWLCSQPPSSLPPPAPPPALYPRSTLPTGASGHPLSLAHCLHFPPTSRPLSLSRRSLLPAPEVSQALAPPQCLSPPASPPPAPFPTLTRTLGSDRTSHL